MDCPRQGRQVGPTCGIEVFDQWVPALGRITEYERLDHRLAISLGCELKYAKKFGYAAANNVDDER